MKKLLGLAALMMMFTAVSFGQSGQTMTEQRALNIARKAIHQECGAEAGGNLLYNQSYNGPCIGGGGSFMVTFYEQPNCPPNQPCILRVRVVGTVTVNCDGSTEVVCGSDLITQ